MADLMLAGVELMLLGMGIVFGFLILLVFVLKGMSRLAMLIENQNDVQAQSTAPAAVSSAVTDQVPVPVIAAAVARYRANHNG